jgi:hypothetical protein
MAGVDGLGEDDILKSMPLEGEKAILNGPSRETIKTSHAFPRTKMARSGGQAEIEVEVGGKDVQRVRLLGEIELRRYPVNSNAHIEFETTRAGFRSSLKARVHLGSVVGV